MYLYCWMHWFWITYQLICIYGLYDNLNESTTMSTAAGLHVNAFANTTNVLYNTIQPSMKTPLNTTNAILTQLQSNSSIATSMENITNMVHIGNSTDLNEMAVIKANNSNANTTTISNTSTTTITFTGTTSTSTTTTTTTTTVHPISNLTLVNNVSMEIISTTPVNVKYQTGMIFERDHNITGNQTTNFTYVENLWHEYNENLTVSITANRNTTTLKPLSPAGIASISVGCVIVVASICATISYLIYRNRGLNRPQVLNDRCSNPDNSGYIDDTSIRDNSEEMYSLDNDSFLNSLEAMTIQNYWTDTVKHTKL